MQFAHAGHDQLFRLGIAIEVERRIFFDDLVECPREFGLVVATFGRDRQGDHRCGERHRRQWKSPSTVPVCKSSILAMATISPGPADSVASVFSPCTRSGAVILTALRAPTKWT